MVDGGQPWCTACEWNLTVYDPQVLPPRGWLWLERWGHGVATRLDNRLFTENHRSPAERSHWTAARVLLVAISTVLVLTALGCLIVGGMLMLRDFPSIWVVPGLGLILLGIVLRPRFGRGPRKRHRLRREQAPVFFALLDEVASAAGAPVPDSVVLASEFNASMARYGLRGHHSLSIGIPLWLVLTPQMRVALVAHEVGHLVNGDPSRGLLVEPALSTFRRFAEATGAERTLGYVFDADRGGNRGIGQLLFELVLWVISRVFLLIHIGLSALGLREHQRAEIRADAVAAHVAGSEALTALLDRSALSDVITTAIGHAAETKPPLRWSELADRLHQGRTAEMTQYRQLTQRGTSLWSSHPPLGLRSSLVESWPQEEPTVALTASQWTQIDEELRPWYTAAHRAVLGARDYRPDSEATIR
ncbi:Zn-dependent protease with chaperone function [Kribbella sp. VKM Ac-2568]|nr:Zn-dependent protease with chaperone function [Kribbella sp. VKM Ac-2568]